jgi:glycogen debranching enzyme
MIALGMARIGRCAETVRLFEGIYAASCTMDLRRLPELFCGFHRRPGQGPTSYPVACAPQAWAAAALPAFVQACLGISFDPAAGAVRFNRPELPSFVDSLTLRNIGLNDAKVSVLISRTPGEVSVTVIEREGDIRVVTTT